MTTFANEGRAGSAGKANHLEAAAVQRLAEEVLAGEHGPIGFTVNLAEGQSWPKVLARGGLVEHTRQRLVRAIHGIAAEALEKREMDMGAQTATMCTTGSTDDGHDRGGRRIQLQGGTGEADCRTDRDSRNG